MSLGHVSDITGTRARSLWADSGDPASFPRPGWAAAGRLRRIVARRGGSTADDVLTIGLPVTPKDRGPTTKYLAAFEKSTGIHVNSFTTNTATNTWVSVFQEVSTRLAGGQPIDSADIATDKAAVNGFYAGVSSTLLSSFRQLDDLDGHTCSIPIGGNVMPIWYNRKLFSTPGLAEPTPGWTWDEFEPASGGTSSCRTRTACPSTRCRTGPRCGPAWSTSTPSA